GLQFDERLDERGHFGILGQFLQGFLEKLIHGSRLEKPPTSSLTTKPSSSADASSPRRIFSLASLNSSPEAIPPRCQLKHTASQSECNLRMLCALIAHRLPVKEEKLPRTTARLPYPQPFPAAQSVEEVFDRPVRSLL